MIEEFLNKLNEWWSQRDENSNDSFILVPMQKSLYTMLMESDKVIIFKDDKKTTIRIKDGSKEYGNFNTTC